MTEPVDVIILAALDTEPVDVIILAAIDALANSLLAQRQFSLCVCFVLFLFRVDGFQTYSEQVVRSRSPFRIW